MFIKVKGFLYVSQFKLDLSQVFCPDPHGGYDRGAIFAPFSICQDNILRAFYPTRAALPRRGGMLEKRKRNQHHNFGIKEHDISYFGATNEIGLTMFTDVFPFPFNLAPLKFFSGTPAYA